MTRSILRRILAVLAMLVALGFAGSIAATAASASPAHGATSIVNTGGANAGGGHTMSAFADWWW